MGILVLTGWAGRGKRCEMEGAAERGTYSGRIEMSVLPEGRFKGRKSEEVQGLPSKYALEIILYAIEMAANVVRTLL